MGVLLSLVLVAKNARDKEPLYPPLTAQEKQDIATHRTNLLKALGRDEKLAEVEYKQVTSSRQIGIKEKLDAIYRLVDKYAHTRMASEMVQIVNELRQQVTEAEEYERQQETESAYDPGIGAEETQPPPGPVGGENDAIQLKPSEDDIGATPGGDTGEDEL
jgi:hypothetical protein